MGTNYYLQLKNQNTGRTKDIHICKCSYGWTPSLRGYKNEDVPFFNEPSGTMVLNIETWVQWKWFLLKETNEMRGGLIFNEYDELIDVHEFFRDIKRRQTEDGYGNSLGHPKKNHAEEALKGEFSNGYIDSYAKTCWVDPEGYSFRNGEFS